MKKPLILSALLMLVIIPLAGQVYRTVEIVTPGTLSDSLNAIEKNTVTHLTVTGTLDSMDFITMRDDMPVVSYIDLHEASTVNNVIPEAAFAQKFFLDTLLLPLSITAIHTEALNGCSGLTSLYIPPGVTLLARSVFASCRNLKTITIPASVASIGSNQFAWCQALTDIEVDGSNAAFSSENGVLFNKNKTILMVCPGGKAGKYTIPATVKEISYDAFANCNKIDSIFIPASVTKIGSIALFGCTILSDIQVDEASDYFCDVNGVLYNKEMTVLVRYPSIKPGIQFNVPFGVEKLSNNSFQACSLLNSVIIPSTVREIADNTFYKCTSLTFMKLPPSVTNLGIYVFNNCDALDYLVLPSSLKTIGRGLVNSCSGLDSIKVNAVEPYYLITTRYYFSGVDTNTCVLQVPSGSLEDYRTATHWRSFDNIVEFSFTLSASENSLAMGAAEGSKAAFSIESNTEWRIYADQPWLHPGDTLGMDNALITVTAEANPGLTERQTTLTLAGLGTDPAYIIVTQAAGSTSIEKINQGAIKIYPNPAIDKLYINGACGATLTLVDLQGKKLFDKFLRTENEIVDMTSLKPGVYVLKIGEYRLKVGKI
jgi:hypothetical protein